MKSGENGTCAARTWSAVPKYSGILENFSISELIKGVNTSAPDPNLITVHAGWGSQRRNQHVYTRKSACVAR